LPQGQRRGLENEGPEAEPPEEEASAACAGVKGPPELGTFKRGRGRGQQGREPPVCKGAAVLSLDVQEDRGEEGRVERPELRGPEAGRRIV
jgi:hypothetical protein